MVVICVDNGINQNGSYTTKYSEAELARVLQQEELFSYYEGGLFPERPDILAGVERVLEAACGPGGWALQVAATHPNITVVGIDRSQQMIEYARSRARMRNIQNARFSFTDITQLLELTDGSFDLVNARFLQPVLPRSVWPLFISECKRVLRPGGILRLGEFEFGASNMPATNRLMQLVPEVFYQTGRSFSPDGHSMGITYMLGHFLRAGGYCDVNLRAYAVDYSVGSPCYQSFTQYLRITFSQYFLGSYLTKEGIMTQEAYEDLYERALREMLSDQFCAIAYFLTVLGERPR
jgi:SAM-dependent methyltransferase